MNVKRKKFGFTPLEMKVSNEGSKRFLTGFTIVELLTVLGIIALLVGLLLPALSWVRNTARETKQKAQFVTISLALMAFKTDYGDYPPSYWEPGSDYCGAQKLAEALLGWDLLGFHPKSDFRSNGLNDDGFYVYDTADPILFGQRRGPYLELATTNAFRLGGPEGLFNDGGLWLNPDRFMICDVFGIPERKITLANGETVTPGTPILYYRANTSSKSLEETSPGAGDGIYNIRDNAPLVDWDVGHLGRIADGRHHELVYPMFYEKITDPKASGASGIPWPYRPDSYILISAGADGLYGTSDDITNFGN